LTHVSARGLNEKSVGALRANAVRSFRTNSGTCGRSERLPLTGDASHAFAPRALGDPDAVVAMNAVQRSRPRGYQVIGFGTDCGSAANPCGWTLMADAWLGD